MTADDPPTIPARGTAVPPPAEHHHRRLEQLAHAIGADDDLPIDPDLGTEDAAAPSPRRPRPGRLARAHRAHPAILAVIFAGGFLGTLARYGVEPALPTAPAHFPTATFIVNTSGAFVLGLLLTVLLERVRRAGRLVRPFAVTGVLGGWTTYSTMVVESVTIGHAGRLALAAGYLALSLLCGVAGGALGIAFGRSRQLDALANVAPDVWRSSPLSDDRPGADSADSADRADPTLEPGAEHVQRGAGR